MYVLWSGWAEQYSYCVRCWILTEEVLLVRFAALDGVENYPVIRAQIKFGTDFERNLSVVASLFWLVKINEI